MENDQIMSVSYVNVLIQLLGKLGHDTDTLLNQSGINKSELSKPDSFINSSQYHALIHGALKMTNEPALGLYYGQMINVSTLGIFGYATLSCPNLEKAAEVAQKYEKLAHQLIKTTLHLNQDQSSVNSFSSIRIESQTSDPVIYRFEIESSFSSVYRIWLDLLGNVDGLNSIHFKYPQPDHFNLYKSFFTIPVNFDSTYNEIYFIQKSLKPLQRLSNPSIFRIAEKQCALLLGKLEQQTQNALSLSSHVRQLLLQLPGDFFSQEQMAKHLNMTSRTLARQLEKENSSFKQILELVKKELALQCMTFTDLTVDEIAYILNYNDASNFTRAFKRWTGLTPSQYKCKKK